MRHLVDHRKLGRHTSHRKALLRNLATSLVLSERIETTVPKAKELRRLADELITLGKEGTLAARRRAAAILQVPEAVQKLFSGLAARFSDRNGGYTRIYKFGYRRGDSAEMAAIEYLGYVLPEPRPKKDEEGEEKKSEKKTEPKKEKKAVAPKKEKPAKEKKEAKPEKKTEKKAKAEKGEKKEKAADKKSWGLFGKKKKES